MGFDKEEHGSGMGFESGCFVPDPPIEESSHADRVDLLASKQSQLKNHNKKAKLVLRPSDKPIRTIRKRY